MAALRLGRLKIRPITLKLGNTTASRTVAYQPITTREVAVSSMYGSPYSIVKAISPDRWMRVIDTYTTIIEKTVL